MKFSKTFYFLLLQLVSVKRLKKCILRLLRFSRAKLKEIQAGSDGFLVFDPDLVQPLLQVGDTFAVTFTFNITFLGLKAVVEH